VCLWSSQAASCVGSSLEHTIVYMALKRELHTKGRGGGRGRGRTSLFRRPIFNKCSVSRCGALLFLPFVCREKEGFWESRVIRVRVLRGEDEDGQ